MADVSIDEGVSVAPADAAEIWSVLDVYMKNYRMPILDYIDAHIAMCHFPHVRIASHNVVVIPDAAAYKEIGSQIGEYMKDGWDHSVWTTGRMVQADPEKVHITVTFERFTKDDELLESQASFYVVEKIDGRTVTFIFSWGVAPAWNITTPGFQRVHGTIGEDGVLRGTLDYGAEVAYTLSQDQQTLSGEYVLSGHTTHGRFTR